ncbi:MAG: NAD(+)/NADH kinase [Treponema sp.]|jgi:NAD+ kinase|nr:NAD(+)/NADH kinase [Treponema sp.]
MEKKAGHIIKKAALFVSLHKKNSTAVSRKIQTDLEKRGIITAVYLYEGKPEPPPDLNLYISRDSVTPPKGEWDIAFSLGGDGTVLYTARCIAPLGVPILPVNLGSLGFIAGVDDWLDVFQRWERGDLSLSHRHMLEVSVERASQSVMKNICLNDIVISADGIAKLINLGVQLSVLDENLQNAGKPASETEVDLVNYRCDGLIISTPTGSTAYSMAAGGPILDPEMEAVILTPICPFTLSNRPFVLPSRRTIVITVARQQRSGVLLTVDGQDTFNLECADRVIIKQASRPALLILADRHAYYSALRTKLFWSGDSCGAAG